MEHSSGETESGRGKGSLWWLQKDAGSGEDRGSRGEEDG